MREFALEVFFSRWQSAARYHLTASNSEELRLNELIALADTEDRLQWESLAFGYSNPRGAVALRQVIAAEYHDAAAESIICFSGAQEAIHATMHALLGRDDHVIVVTPNYQATETIPLSICATTGVALDPNDGWSLDIERIAQAIRPNTKLVSINFPNNPTGKILEHDRFAALIALCRKHGVWLFSDEVYRLIERDSARRLPMAVDVYERGISLGALSKSYGLPGLRVGWIACRDQALLAKTEQVKHYLSICNPAPCEVLARIALKAGDAILTRNRSIAARNWQLLVDFFEAHSDHFDWCVPDGGVVAYPRYKGAEGVESFCARLIEEDGILLLPATIFRSELTPTPEDRFRIGFGRSDFVEGLAAMDGSLRRPSASRSQRDGRARETFGHLAPCPWPVFGTAVGRSI
jgi:aspartate/methionine/tyrosine aminotransferase